MTHFVVLAGGIAGLWLGTECTVRGALGLAERFRVSPTVIGLTVLAIGTDLPETFMAVTGALHRLDGIETSGIIIGNALGSCLGQIGLILGLAGLSGQLTVSRRSIYRDGGMLLGSLVLVTLAGWNGEIHRLEGVGLLVVYALYYASLFRDERERRAPADAATAGIATPVTLLVIGIGVLLPSSHLVVQRAVALSESWGLQQTFVGIVILALGSSLPELVLSIGAIIRKAPGLSVGNIIGSNVFDTLVPIGAGAAIAGLVVDRSLLVVDVPILAALSALAMAFFLWRKGLQRREALMLAVFYCLYVLFKILQMPERS